ncbi:hypothetical protein GQX74_003668 [Glossina fuscipes]|nr:hypothetical protein GQX74_003668 [Glossina fuscipes]
MASSRFNCRRYEYRKFHKRTFLHKNSYYTQLQSMLIYDLFSLTETIHNNYGEQHKLLNARHSTNLLVLSGSFITIVSICTSLISECNLLSEILSNASPCEAVISLVQADCIQVWSIDT